MLFIEGMVVKLLVSKGMYWMSEEEKSTVEEERSAKREKYTFQKIAEIAC